MGLKTYFLNVFIAILATFFIGWMFDQAFNTGAFAGALLGVFFWDYLNSNK